MAQRFRVAGFVGVQPFIVKVYADDAYDAVCKARQAFLVEQPDMLPKIDKILVKVRKETPKSGNVIHVGKVRAARRTKEEMALVRAEEAKKKALAEQNGESAKQPKNARGLFGQTQKSK